MKKSIKKLALFVLIVVFAISSAFFVLTSCDGNKNSSTGSETSSGGPASGSGSGGTAPVSSGGTSSGGDEEQRDPVTIPIAGTVRYDFDVIAGYGKITGDGVTVNSEEGVGSWITGFTWNNNAQAVLNIYADEECQADIVIKVRKTTEIAVLTSKIIVALGGEVIESDAEIAASDEGDAAEFDEVNLGQFWLSQGDNEIKITPMDSTDNFDFMSVIFYTENNSANLRWTALKDVEGMIFYGIDDHVLLTGDYKKNLEENCIGVAGYTGATAVFPVYSSREAIATISVITCSMPVSNVFTSFYDFSINGERQTSAATTLYGPLWGDYGIVTLGDFIIDGGLNEISITAPDFNDYAQHYNIRAIIIKTDADIAWEEVEAEPHICLSVCPVCGNCKNLECEEEVCLTKCSCQTEDINAAANATIEKGKLDASNDVGCARQEDGAYQTALYFVLEAESAGKAALSVVISSTTGGTFRATDVFKTTINDEVYTSEAVTVNDGIPWTSYHTISLGVIELKEGRNIIRFDHTHLEAGAAATNYGEAVNFRGIVLTTSVGYTVVREQTEPEEKGVLYTFNAIDEKVEITDGLTKNESENYVDVVNLTDLQKITFTVYSETDQTVNLGFCISNNPTAIWTLVDYFRVWINVESAEQNDTNKLDKTVYTAETIQGSQSDFNDIMIGEVELKAGENTVTLGWTCVGDTAYKFTVRSLLVRADGSVTLV